MSRREQSDFSKGVGQGCGQGCGCLLLIGAILLGLMVLGAMSGG